MPRCISSATMAAPLSLRLPATAQLLLPTILAYSAAAVFGAAPGAGSDVSLRGLPHHAGGGGIATSATAMAVASSGASHGVDSGARKARCSGVAWSLSQPRASSRDSRLPCKSKYMAQITSRESDADHARGCMPTSAYSNGRAASAPRPALTPAEYRSSSARSAAGRACNASSARARKRCRRWDLSSGTARAPNSSASSPAATRRNKSIWK
jgi:hypothetical protein